MFNVGEMIQYKEGDKVVSSTNIDIGNRVILKGIKGVVAKRIDARYYMVKFTFRRRNYAVKCLWSDIEGYMEMPIPADRKEEISNSFQQQALFYAQLAHRVETHPDFMHLLKQDKYNLINLLKGISEDYTRDGVELNK